MLLSVVFGNYHSLAVQLGKRNVTRIMDSEHLKSAAVCCPLPAALEAMGERWSFLILRGAFNGLVHFEQFQSTLGIARNILSNRLTRLVENGIMARNADLSDRRKVAYRLTEKGLALLPVLIALRQWGECYGDGRPSNPVLVDSRDRQPVRTVAVQAQDGRALGIADLEWVDRSQLV